jgi:metal-responsive CopG/Arc/MetJ family transcriptional regulator
MVRLQPDLLEPLDRAASSLGEASRPEAIRRILRDWLIGRGFLKGDTDAGDGRGI